MPPRQLDAALFEAAQDQEFERACELVAKGARGDVLFSDESAIFLAARREPRWMRLLLTCSDPNLADLAGSIPLGVAAGYANLEVVAMLLPLCDPWHADADHERPLGWLIHHGCGFGSNPTPHYLHESILPIFRLFAQADPRLLQAEIPNAPPWAKAALSATLAELEARAIDADLAGAAPAKAPRL